MPLDGHDSDAMEDRLRFAIDEEAEPTDLRPLARLLLSLAGHQLPGVDLPRRDRDASDSDQPGMLDTTSDKRKAKGRPPP
jgi:hypothetical protein